jgi:ABC-type sugar transport system ATPase subunit
MSLVIRGIAQAGGTTLDIDLEAHPGVTVITGASAAGKTLLLRAIAGLHPFEGTLTFDGRELGALDPNERGLGYAPQEPATWPHLSVSSHLSPFADRTRIDALVLALDLASLLTRKTNVLSGGERQRLSIARALARKPKLLLLDEPTGALDRATRERVGDLIKRDAVGATILFVTHDLTEARRMGDAFAVVESGKVRAEVRDLEPRD